MWKFSQQESKMSDKTKESDKSKTPDKLDKFLAGGDITLNCLISDEGVNDIFEVTISNANNNRVSSLAEAIRTRRPDRFQYIDSTNLALYRVAFIADSVIINSLRNISEFEVEGAIRMEPQDTIFTHFPIQPQRIFGGEKGINVIVYPPAERVPEVLSKDN
ncbi:hypothetical protein RhiirC2_703690 [Rhizophagus irregularis]|uniref:Crinkler effector protein N-terminal domain-containing protein n=1 Tax=Rhizophagus irregularis TaxID=588596 RepID=A0A2N1M226_9GLOM|nr:hypothetical protein RhiirC2_703690 [Rhizophagus irregularis]